MAKRRRRKRKSENSGNPEGPKTKAQQFVETIVLNPGMSQRKAAIAAGYSQELADNPKRLWMQKNVQAHYQDIVQDVLPPEKVRQLFTDLLEGKTTMTRQRMERLAGKDEHGNPTSSLQIVAVEKSETIDRSVQLRALALAAEHGGLIPSSVRAQAITSASLEEVLERARAEHIKNGELMTPTWLKERAKRLALAGGTNGHGAATPPQLETVITVEPQPEPQPPPKNTCDACGQERCEHGRCPACDVCAACESEVPAGAMAV